MTRWAERAAALRRVPLKDLPAAVTRRIDRGVRLTARRARASLTATHEAAPPGTTIARLLPSEFFIPPDPSIASVAPHYRAHRFDLLGSGWIEVRHGMACRGLEGHRYSAGARVTHDPAGDWLLGRINGRNLATSQRVWQLVSADYVPIDWQLDFKSGFRWSERTWYQDISFGMNPGADVKIPWELSRMQHLPELAVLFASNSEQWIVREFQDQVLDWIANNPPSFGVNWNSAMDVGIRAANWLVAFDILSATEAPFSSDFREIFTGSVVAHGRHILRNLEWSEHGRSNHYLANIAGLLAIAAYLPSSARYNAWLAFALQELVAEVSRQFLKDGGHFEASTSYHRLCLEMALDATALGLAIPTSRLASLSSISDRQLPPGPRRVREPLALHDVFGDGLMGPFPPLHFEQLERAAGFLLHATKPDGHIVQIGDNDSGRFIRIGSRYLGVAAATEIRARANLDGYQEHDPGQRYWIRDDLETRDLIARADGLLRHSHVASTGRERELAQAVTFAPDGTAAKYSRRSDAATELDIGDEPWTELQARLEALPNVRKFAHEFRVEYGDLRAGPSRWAYPDFGLYVFRSSRVYLSIRCGAIGHDGLGAHAHNDQLAIELVVDGRVICTDPGSYLYTPSRAWRDAYRSIHAHPAPACDQCEPSSLARGIFSLGNDAAPICLHWTDAGFAGQASIGCGQVTRLVAVGAAHLAVIDYYVTNGTHRPHERPPWSPAVPVPFSSGYGTRARE